MKIELKVTKRNKTGTMHEFTFSGILDDAREHDFPTVKDLWEIERTINESTSGLRAHIDLTSE